MNRPTDSLIQPVRGMKDVLPADILSWQKLEAAARELFADYAYQEVRVPILERTQLFKRSIGELTDIVQKEMFTFEEPDGDSLTLRPEATAGIVRAMISNGLLHNQRQRVWCSGPMFRHERPQRGRYRQFYQLDVEAFGYPGPDIDAELIMLSARLLERVGLLERLELNLNSLGTPQARQAYRAELTAYFTQHKSQLDGDSLRRLEGNPLRILDSKNPEVQALVAAAPLLPEFLDAESQSHFATLCRHLDAVGIRYTLNPRLVRGLDYYSRTVFEWVTSELGAQSAVCSGGRYDGLVAQLGGEPTPAVGWAMGEERVVELMRMHAADAGFTPDVYLVIAGTQAEAQGIVLAERLRRSLPGVRLEAHCGGGSFKSQLRRADKSGARIALILGDGETERGCAGLKLLRADAAQIEVPWEHLAARVSEHLQDRAAY